MLRLFHRNVSAIGLTKMALRKKLYRRSELLPGAVDKAFFSQFTSSLEFLELLLQGKS